jgi:hypothetical protein
MTMTAVSNVVRRFKASVGASALGIGREIEVGNVRIHRYRDQFQVWDLTNAGKRGKTVRTMTILPSYSYPGDRDQWMENMSKALPEYPDYDKIKGLIRDVLVDYPGEIDLHESTVRVRGIDVNPGGTTSVQFNTNTGLTVEADPLAWSVRHRQEITGPKGNKFNQDTSYYPRGRRDVAPFYNWLKANLAEAAKMDIQGYRKLWTSLKIRYDFH